MHINICYIIILHYITWYYVISYYIMKYIIFIMAHYITLYYITLILCYIITHYITHYLYSMIWYVYIYIYMHIVLYVVICTLHHMISHYTLHYIILHYVVSGRGSAPPGQGRAGPLGNDTGVCEKNRSFCASPVRRNDCNTRRKTRVATMAAEFYFNFETTQKRRACKDDCVASTSTLTYRCL